MTLSPCHTLLIQRKIFSIRWDENGIFIKSNAEDVPLEFRDPHIVRRLISHMVPLLKYRIAYVRKSGPGCDEHCLQSVVHSKSFVNILPFR